MPCQARTILGSLAIIAALLMAPVGAARAEGYWQCVPFARMLSGIQIFGDAWTWWDHAQGKYQTGGRPQAGSVLVFKSTGKMRKGHVAVVSQVLTDRLIQISHANWSQINGSRGQVEQDVIVADVSAKGDWSTVKVWYDPIGDLGSTVYPTYGFVYPDATARVLAGAVRGVQTAVNTPGQIITGVTETTDRFAALIEDTINGD